LAADSSSESDPSDSEDNYYNLPPHMKVPSDFSRHLSSFKQLDGHLQNIEEILKTDTLSKD
jgi:hypothetical protein